MVRLLLHSEDALYDATTKQYRFSLDKRIDKPNRIKIINANYSAATQTTYPLVVYVRSNALNRVIRNKHTLRLKNNNHEETTNVLCTLQETHTIARYSLAEEGKRVFRADPHFHLTDIDIYFTNNDTVLDGAVTAPPLPDPSSTLPLRQFKI